MTLPADKQLVKALTNQLRGEVYTDSTAITNAAKDFGQVVFRKPQVVVCPQSKDDVVTIIQHAQKMGYAVSIRGAGHSQGGQSLTEQGIVIDTRNLCRIIELNEQEGWIIAETGMLWKTLIKQVMKKGLMPPILTDTMEVTLGGTLSVGGIGSTSFQQGPQANCCLGLEVVLGTGEVMWLSPEDKPELFYYVLYGLGQFGIITKVKLRLRPFQRYTQTVHLTYSNLQAFLTDAMSLVNRMDVQALEGFAYPEEEGGCRYVLEVSKEVNQLAYVGSWDCLQNLNDKGRTVVNRQTEDYPFRLEKEFGGYKRPSHKDRAHPWVEHFMPVSAVAAYVTAVAPTFPSTSLLLWPLKRENFHFPMLVIPETPDIILVGLMVSIPTSELSQTLPLLQEADKRGIALGGKRYLSGWINFNQQQWCQHYGPATWQHITQLKQRCDPKQILQSFAGLGNSKIHPAVLS